MYNTGKLYYAEIISKFTYLNNVFNYCPEFNDFNEDRANEFIDLYKKNIIKIDWLKYIPFEECCICFNNTCHFTECSHMVCIDCLKTLLKCPICRRLLHYKNYTHISLEENFILDRIQIDDVTIENTIVFGNGEDGEDSEDIEDIEDI